MGDKVTLVFIFALFVSTVAYKSYLNYKVYKVIPSNEVQVQALTNLREDYEFWTDEQFSVGDDVRILVAPTHNEEFVKNVKSIGINPEVVIKNVQELIDYQLRPSAPTRSSSLGFFSWNAYHNLSEIHAWLEELAEAYPTVVRTVVIGYSTEGREIKGVVIDFKPGQRGEKPLTGMIEGGIHAREWISPATVTWIINEFLTSNDADVRFMAEAIVWHIFPVVNPDGYEYTFSNDRMWRKNRNPTNYINCSSSADIGNGIDLNRNFDFRWMSIGATQNPCDNNYAGPSPSSELEAQAIMAYVNQTKETSNLMYYFAFHSYGQLVLNPYSHSTGYGVLDSGNYGDLYEISIRGADKLRSVHGTSYTVGTSAEVLYAVSGSSFDWVKGVANIPIVLLFELRDTLTYGFLLPPDQIVPNNEEIMACLVEMEKTTRLLGYYQSNAKSFTLSLILFWMSLYFSLNI